MVAAGGVAFAMVGAVRRWMSSASGLLLLARWRVCFCFFSMDAPPSLAATLTGRARVPAVVVLLPWRGRGGCVGGACRPPLAAAAAGVSVLPTPPRARVFPGVWAEG